MAEVNFNATFNKFVEWANRFDAKSSAIVGASDMLGEGLVVDTKSGDGSGFIAMIRRSGAHKDINNTTRALFFGAVKDMFGGESKIPQSVRKAMKFDNFTDTKTGKPLTARRIHIIQAAIEKFVMEPKNRLVDPNTKTGVYNVADYLGSGKALPADKGIKLMTEATKVKTLNAAETTPVKGLNIRQAREMIDQSLSIMKGVALNEEQKQAAASGLMEYGKKMPPKNLRALSNYIVSRMGQGSLYEEDLELFVKDIKKWRDFSFGDPRTTKLGAKFAERLNTAIKEYSEQDDWGMKQDDWCMTDDKKKLLEKNVAQQCWNDIECGSWNVDGTKIECWKPGTTQKDYRQNVMDKMLGAIINKVKDEEKQPKVTHAITTLLNQLVFADITTIQQKVPALIGTDPYGKEYDNLYSMEGADLFVSRTNDRNDLDSATQIVVEYGASFDLQISDDGKTATITAVHDDHISSTGAKMESCRIGKVSTAQRITLDLTADPMPVVTNVAFSQKFTPDEVFDKQGLLYEN